MPTYQYACTECGEHLEAVQAFSDDPLTECPACQGRLRKVFSSVGVVFKGSGFYKNDSRAAAKAGTEKKKDAEPAAGTPTGTTPDGTAAPAAAKDAKSGDATPAKGAAGTTAPAKAGDSSKVA
ncbi:MAG TPA: FmdB family zinc ribbon protein [Mycobacteriales bacterium]|nr:FmdB family zinc ribbon protein [Mycobacteriales bacterium]